MKFVLAACLLLLHAEFHPAATHDFHVSRLTINLNTATEQLEFTLDSFIDDIEFALAGESSGKYEASALNLLEQDEHPAVDSLLSDYLQSTLKLRDKRASIPVQYLGKESAPDPYGLYIYLQAFMTGDKDMSITLDNSFLLDLYGDQQNIVIWQVDGVAGDNVLLTKSKRTYTFSL